MKLSETLRWYFLFFSFSCSTKIDSEDLFWLDAEFTCVTRTSKNAVSPRDGTIASLSINTEGGSAALVLTRKQEWKNKVIKLHSRRSSKNWDKKVSLKSVRFYSCSFRLCRCDCVIKNKSSVAPPKNLEKLINSPLAKTFFAFEDSLSMKRFWRKREREKRP